MFGNIFGDTNVLLNHRENETVSVVPETQIILSDIGFGQH